MKEPTPSNRCDKCPTILRLLGRLAELGMEAEYLERRRQQLDTQRPQDTHDELKESIVLSRLSADSEEDELKDVLAELTSGCAGPLTMRATRGGIQHTATICSSPVMPFGTESTELVTVTRRKV